MENYGACDRCDQEEDTKHMLIDCDQLAEIRKNYTKTASNAQIK